MLSLTAEVLLNNNAVSLVTQLNINKGIVKLKFH